MFKKKKSNIRIAFDKNKLDLDQNASLFQRDKIYIEKYYLDRIDPSYGTALNDFCKKIQEQISKKNPPPQYMKALYEQINSLAQSLMNISSTELDESTKNYLSDKIARITRRVLYIVNNDKNNTIRILSSLTPFINWFDENVEEVVDDISQDNYLTDLDSFLMRKR
jgi:hypothetical protein